jgi:hypothetical protein
VPAQEMVAIGTMPTHQTQELRLAQHLFSVISCECTQKLEVHDAISEYLANANAQPAAVFVRTR